MAEQAVVQQQAAIGPADRLGDGQHTEIGKRFNDDDQHVGCTEGSNLRQVFSAEAMSVQRPETDPQDDAALIGGRECERLGVGCLLYTSPSPRD